MKMSLACAKDKTSDVEFWLEQDGGIIRLRGRKSNNGDSYGFYILSINPDGLVLRHPAIDATGIPVNSEGLIKIHDVD